VPGRNADVENLLEMSDKAKLSDQDMVQLVNGLIDKLQNSDMRRNIAVWTQVCHCFAACLLENSIQMHR